MRLLVLLISIWSYSALAGCYVVGDLKGHSAFQDEGFALSKDGISSQKFILEFDGEKSSVSPNDLSCFQVGLNTLFCAYVGNDESTVEIWTVYPDENKVTYSKSRNGFGILNSASMFVGNIKGRCD
ncbi:hypothetical protein WD347_004447 [Vibrio parahaemolyticus]|uniref:hypothetical protein n=1 Tax=Vibrio parahaemolyticus TaxID=670 RepID=UPI00038E63E1|nr:hypothetical protein [Vibrio parahaemolyticus]EJG0923707.1 hypothetical protein [Vibrio parahaemolyticus O1:K68]EJG0933373.1 hypothetical protein [Vibrio parahaemolyticus O1]EJG0947481.1 hypothetical protein [Vibrio parahaemolyticus O10]EQM49640.1 putative lipoprotein [Vibrio parahaemolyticus VPCR-2010]EGQ9064965.1 hypothetical protein [Vibrio parahaemolyticus]